MLFIAIGCLAGSAAASPSIVFSPSTLTLMPGETAEVALRLTEAPDGLNGYQFDITFPPAIAKITGATFPAWAILKKDTAGQTSFRLSAIDMNKQVQAGLTNIELATITISGVGSGTGAMTINALQIDSDADTTSSPSTGTLQVTVTGSGSATTTATTTTAAPTTSATTAATTAPLVTATMGVMPGAPIAGFTAAPSAGSAPLKVQFYDRSTNSPTSYEWDFGDGGTSMIQNPSYTYYADGLYTVRLRAANSKGSTSVVQKDYIAVGEEYIGTQPTIMPLLTITEQDLPAPSKEILTATATTGQTTGPAVTTRKAATDSMTMIAGILILFSVLVMVRKTR